MSSGRAKYSEVAREDGFETRDFYLACFLRCTGYELLDLRAEVEELMALLDRLEAARTAREATRDGLTAASLARLTASDTGPETQAPSGASLRTGTDSPSDDAPNLAVSGKVEIGFPSDTARKADSFPANARFALDALPALTARPDQIKPLRQTILNLAVRGKLVPQDPTDEPASELLKRIDKERIARVSKGEMRKAKGIAPPPPDAQLSSR